MERPAPLRVRDVNDASLRADGEYVLYWMTAFRRPFYNFSLDRAVAWSRELKKPLLVFEALRIGYQWACDRFHQFVIEGMADNAAHFAKRSVCYYPYLEPESNAARGLLDALAARACVVVADDFPAFFLPRMLNLVARRVGVKVEAVDSNGLLPLRATDRVFELAHSFRRFLQGALPQHLEELPHKDPLLNAKLPELEGIPEEIAGRWPPVDSRMLSKGSTSLAAFAINHTIAPVERIRGGFEAAKGALKTFVAEHLDRYVDERNEPDQDVGSGLSPWLHFGHISAHEVFLEIARREEWTPAGLGLKATGSREGWWGMSPAAEEFLDQLATWRELGYNMAWQRKDYDRYESLPEWAKKTLRDHAKDERPQVYSLEEFAAASTHDRLWNAAQRQLVREGRIHNYLRMLWGKKILEWTKSPQEALAVMIELNNRYALDGRNPNSYSGIFWVLGRYDRAWGPERPIFGKIRYMTSENTARKVGVKQYLERYAEVPEGHLFAE